MGSYRLQRERERERFGFGVFGGAFLFGVGEDKRERSGKEVKGKGRLTRPQRLCRSLRDVGD